MTAVRVLAGWARGPLEWGCERCGREDTSAIRNQPEAQRRRIRNCDDAENVAFEVVGHPRLRRCPWSQIEDRDVLAVERWVRWKTLAAWPYPGTAAEQPAMVVDEMEACESAFAEAAQEQREKPPPTAAPTKKRR